MSALVDGNMRVGFRTRSLDNSRLRFIRQTGVSDVFPIPVNPNAATTAMKEFDPEKGESKNEGQDSDQLLLGEGTIPSTASLRAIRDRLAQFDLTFTGIHTIFPSQFDEIAFGRAGRDEQLSQLATLIRHMGEAGIPILGYQWHLTGVGRTAQSKRIRGEATATEFVLSDYNDQDDIDETYTDAEFWEHYEYFLGRILPVAEDAGVTLALHPADPPVVDQLDGIPRLFRDVESFKRAMEVYPSENHGLKLCLGCFSEMGADIVDVIDHFGNRDEIVFIHFRDVEGTMPSFHETFVDEGNFDEHEVVQALDRVGFDGVLIPDHVPQMEGDTWWGHRSRAYTAGYLRGLIRAVSDSN